MNTLAKRALLAIGATTFLAACGGASMSGLSENNQTWQLVSGEADGQAMDLSQSAKAVTLSFVDGEAIVGQGPVNQYRYPVTISGGNIHADAPLITTRMAGPMPAMQFEQSYFTALEQAQHISRSDKKLTISGDGVALIYQPQ
ncbi:META domain-containing protein [Suttonella sp. R2A3]|uniref:META domain-containing protein n=1 Tax=Suttonella sp. R2A3 TaxID=2908648 RepID=UPI001F2EB5B6|nr:META domain-containing protein [Suttonella sp. R2A3]UJF24270.1 META domain-containing protein [Suttonella sp. R2A3]